jgi:hypothetical protein
MPWHYCVIAAAAPRYGGRAARFLRGKMRLVSCVGLAAMLATPACAIAPDEGRTIGQQAYDQTVSPEPADVGAYDVPDYYGHDPPVIYRPRAMIEGYWYPGWRYRYW